MTELGKWIALFGGGLLLIGGLVWALGKLGFRGLAGDIRYESEQIRFYFPIVTCLVLSVLLSTVVWLWQWISRR